MRLPVFVVVAVFLSPDLLEADPLPGTAPLEWPEEDFSNRLMQEAHEFIKEKIDDVSNFTLGLGSDTEERQARLQQKRTELSFRLGVVDERPPVKVEFIDSSTVTLDGIPLGSRIAEGPGFEVHQIRWTVLPGFSAEGLYVTPTGANASPTAPPAMVLLPDAGETPEDVVGLTGTLTGRQQMGLRFASSGFRIVIPTTLSRAPFAGFDGDDETISKTDQSNREWIYRQAFQMGRHPLGYEIQAALAAVDWLRAESLADTITTAGYGEGGRAAFYAAALTNEINHAFISGVFGPRTQAWSEPIDRNLFHLLPHYRDAEIAAMIYPRPLLIENTEFPTFESGKGSIRAPTREEVEKEFDRIEPALGTFGTPPGILIHHANKAARSDYPAVAAFLQTVGIEREVDRIPPIALLIDNRVGFDAKARELRVLAGMQRHVQDLVDQSLTTRREFFFDKAEPGLRSRKWSVEREHETLSPVEFITKAGEFRREFQHDIIGEFGDDLSPLTPRSRLIRETEKWSAWDVVLEVYPGFHAWGTLLLPNDLKESEKRPLVVCQHGRNGLPRDLIDEGKPAYNDFAAELAERGFITFCPFNLYRGEDEYRWLDRKANQVGATLFTFIAASHEQFLNWFPTLPQVDPDRIAFYGLSYGGEAAMRLPAIFDEYCLTICSGDFNNWTRKVSDPDFPATYMRTIEWEMPYWNMGNTFDYGEMAGLIFPRPLFVERGHYDRVSEDEYVAFEYARVRRLYAAFGESDKTEIEFFPGGHSVRGVGSFEFLHKHLDWPAPE